MNAPTWQAFYQGDWQFPFAVMVAPFAFLLYRAIAREQPEGALAPALAPFVSWWVTLFTLETLIDPVATGPLAKALDAALAARGLPASVASQVLGTIFVVLGDFRVYWLVLRFRAPERRATAAAFEALGLCLIAPVCAGLVALREGPPQAMWLAHELVSLGIVFGLARLALPSALTHPRYVDFVRRVLGFVVAYYGLWAAADVLILCGVDAGWPVRLVPNQLYYGLFVPFVWHGFFRRGECPSG